MKIKSIEINDFKGTKHAVYEMNGKSVEISGSNGKGKSTIADAFYYLFCDKDYLLTSNPEIYPIDQEESQPSVTIIAEIDGVDHEFKKWQVRTKKEKNGITEVSTKNEFSINSVPKSATTFKDYLEEKGINLSMFLELSHTEVFAEMLDNKKSRDSIRATLFEMATSKSDIEIANETEGAVDVAKLLSSYSMEEIDAMYKVQKKKATENVNSIPDQIVGLEKAKIEETDVAEMELMKNDLQRQIEELDNSIPGNTKETELKAELVSLKSQYKILESQQNYDYGLNRQGYVDLKNTASQKVKAINDKITWTNTCIDSLNRQIESNKAERLNMEERYKSVKAIEFDESKWVYNEDSEICPNCGQAYPKDRIEDIRNEFEEKHKKALADFEENKREEMQVITEQAKQKKQDVLELEKQLADYTEQIAQLNVDLEQANLDLDKAETELTNLPKMEDLEPSSEMVDLLNQIDLKQAEIDSMAIVDTNIGQTANKITELKNQVSEIDKKLGAIANNDRIDEQIAELKAEQIKAEQEKANAEKILYQLSLVSMAKNEQLSAEINKHFKLVDFIFFDYQKNGEIKDVVIPMVDGKKLGQSMNTGLEIMAKLDIINGLQNFFNAEIPVFLDQAEKLDSVSTKKVCELYNDLQIIFLKVADSELKVEEI